MQEAPLSPAPQDDATRLLHLARSGDIAAFDAFYNATIRLLMPAVRRVCGEAHADDVLADTYFQVWNSLASFDGERCDAMGWLRMIAASRARDRMRCERVRHAGMEGAIEHDADSVAHPHGGPQEMVESRQLTAQLGRAIQTLPARERQVMGLYINDQSHSEISRSMDMPLGTVKSVISRSCSRLRGMMVAGAETTASAA
ncbi:sigma-70 family RNA polymerase sigma factor [soil metagenome]